MRRLLVLGVLVLGLVYNDTTQGRQSLAISLSADEGRTWPWTRHLERHESGSYHYPAVIQGADGMIHTVYSSCTATSFRRERA